MKALETPRLELAANQGVIYKITRLRTGQLYIGLTVVSVASRWKQHVRSAERRSSPLARAIAEDGPDQFTVEIIESNLPLEELPQRERHWIATLGTIWPQGLNKHSGGATGGGGQCEVEHDGETFRSVAAASEELAARHGLTPMAAHQRLRNGRPLNKPLKVKRTLGRGVAGSFLWSRWRAMRNNPNSELCSAWQDWDVFATDLAHLKKSDRLVRLDPSRPWGPDNFVIKRDSFLDHPKVGTIHWTRWRSLLKSSQRGDGHGIAEEWRDFDVFERDVAPGYFEGAVLLPLNWRQPLGPHNFRWGTRADLTRLNGLHGRKWKKHGEAATPTYRRWQSMHNDARRQGFGVAPEWHDYLQFREAVGDGVERDLVLIRPDRSQPWGPNNFRLVTRAEFKATLGRFTHAKSGTPLHKRWLSMRSNAANSGVGCDPRWCDFLSFAADVGEERPGSDLERIDVTRPYGPANFVWVDRAERRAAVEGRRRLKAEAVRRNREERSVIVRGVRYHSLKALAEAYGIPPSTVLFRVQNGMTPEEAVTVPNKNIAAANLVMLDGQEFPSKGAALRYVEERYGIPSNTMQLRMKGGLTLEEAAHKPLGKNAKQSVVLDGQEFPSKGAALSYVKERYGIPASTMQLRLKGGLTLQEAAHKPLGRNSKQFRRAPTSTIDQ